jgi:putative thioredoxin
MTTVQAAVLDVTTSGFLRDVVERSRTQPVLVDFWAAWCGPCRALGPILEKLASEYAGGFVLAKVDTEAEQALASQFQIRSIPTVMLFKEGKVVTGFQGALPEGQIRAFLAQHGVTADGATAVALSEDPDERLVQLRAAVEAHPERDPLKLELALLVATRGDASEAARLLETLPSSVYAQPTAVRARGWVALRQRLAVADAAHAAPIQQILDGDAAAGIAQLIALLRDEQPADESPARATLVEAFSAIEDEEVVREGRRAMARVLF